MRAWVACVRVQERGAPASQHERPALLPRLPIPPPPCGAHTHAALAAPPASAGVLEDFDDGGASASRKESAEEAAARMKLEAAKARQSVK